MSDFGVLVFALFFTVICSLVTFLAGWSKGWDTGADSIHRAWLKKEESIKANIAELQQEIEDLESEIKEWKDYCNEKSTTIDKMSEERALMKDKVRIAAQSLKEFL